MLVVSSPWKPRLHFLLLTVMPLFEFSAGPALGIAPLYSDLDTPSFVSCHLCCSGSVTKAPRSAGYHPGWDWGQNRENTSPGHGWVGDPTTVAHFFFILIFLASLPGVLLA